MTEATPRPAFAHASEAELARILDFYQVRWAYEPETFPIGWSMTGEVVESFSPDFYLPDLDLYVELTTLKQKLVRKKNRKLRRLRELYPDVRIKLFYARDFRMLLLKFGRLALLDDLSGTIGQATPPRPAERIVFEAGIAAGLGEPDAAGAVATVDARSRTGGAPGQPDLPAQRDTRARAGGADGLTAAADPLAEPADPVGTAAASADAADVHRSTVTAAATDLAGFGGAPVDVPAPDADDIAAGLPGTPLAGLAFPRPATTARGRRRGRRRRREAAAGLVAAGDADPAEDPG